MLHDETTRTAPLTMTDPAIETGADATESAPVSGLLSPSELMPLTQTLIPPDLAAVFKISSGPPISAIDVQIASERTLVNLQKLHKLPSSPEEIDDGGSRTPHRTISIAFGNDNQSISPRDKKIVKELGESSFLLGGKGLSESNLMPNGNNLTESRCLPNGKDLTESRFFPNGKALTESSFLRNGKDSTESSLLPNGPGLNLFQNGKNLTESSLLQNGKNLTESSFLPNGKDLTESNFLPNGLGLSFSPNGKNLTESSFLPNGLGRKDSTESSFLFNRSGPKDLTEPKLSNGKDLTESSPLPNGATGRGLKLEADLWGPLDQQQKTPSASYEDAVMASTGTPFLSLDKRPENGYGLSMSGAADSSEGGSGKKLRKRLDIELEDADSGAGLDNSNEEPTARTLKRPRLVWTPQLHKRFVDAVAQLGIKNAVPKTIMQMMNVDGLTRENVASHLQKYRLYLKRTQGLSTDGPSVSDQLFASTPVPPNLAASTHFLSGNGDDMIPLMMPMPMVGISPNHHMPGNLGVTAPFRGFDHNMYNVFGRPSSMQQRYPVMDNEFLLNNQAKPVSSPQQPVLTLFPSGGI